MTPRQANLLTLLALVLLLAGVTLTAPRWARFLRQPLAAVREDDVVVGDGNEPVAAPKAPEAEAERKISVRLYFEAADRAGLLPEERVVPLAGNLARQLRTVAEELVRGSSTGLLPTLPPETKVREVFVSKRGVAYLDFSSEVGKGVAGGSKSELLAVYSIVNSVVANFPAVKKVQILVDDKAVPTLAGHVDVSRPLAPDLTFLALILASPSPEASSSPEAARVGNP
jgi:spore germination protein GerM